MSIPTGLPGSVGASRWVGLSVAPCAMCCQCPSSKLSLSKRLLGQNWRGKFPQMGSSNQTSVFIEADHVSSQPGQTNPWHLKLF